MAKKSEELIEKTVNLQHSKPNMKVSKKKKSSPVSEVITQDTVSVGSISPVQNTIPETKQKRTIRINLNKTKNDKKDVKIAEETKVEKVEIKNKTNRPKRTLKLNIPKEEVVVERPKVTEISINQNASFFYAPSVFEKFSINVTDEDEITEDVIETEPEVKDEIDEIEVETIDPADVYDFESTDVFDINSIVITPIEEPSEEEFVEEIINEDQLDEIDGLDELIDEIANLSEDAEEVISEESQEEEILDKDIDEEEILDEDIDEDITEEDIENFLKNEQDDYVFPGIVKDETIEEPISEPIEVENNQEEIENSIIEETISEEDLLSQDDALLEALLLENDIESEDNDESLLDALDVDVLKEAADNMNLLEEIEEQADDKKNNIIGKFFDSSIPSMVETGGEYFSKIKKSIFTNMSNVFKKFSYDEAELANAANEQVDDAPIAELKEQSVSEIVQNLENVIGTEFSLNNVEVQADPIATINVPVIDEAVLSPTSDNLETGIDGLYANIITPEANPSTDDISIDDELLEEALLNDFSFEDLENLESEETPIEEKEKEIDTVQEILEEQDEDVEEEFDIEDYFGLNNKEEEKIEEPIEQVIEAEEELSPVEEITEENFDAAEFENAFLNANETKPEATTEELISQVSQNMNPQDLSSLSQLLATFNQTITTLSDRIASLENGTVKSNEEELTADDINLDNLDLSDVDLESLGIDLEDGEGLAFNDNGVEEEEPSMLDDFDAFKFEDLADEISLEDLENVVSEETIEEKIIEEETNGDISDILSKAFSEENNLIDEEMKKELLSEVLSVETDNNLEQPVNNEDPTSDFFKIIDSLSKTISELEKAPDVAPKALSNLPVTNVEDGKAINILINKDDIFSISILNETYEIVADFDGISVLSENIHISTPKHNFFVQVGEKYIEIHNKGTYFSLDTSFEDIEFANAINNVSFAKKNNKIELIIKDAFKLSSVNNKVELSMLNTVVADLAKTTATNITNTINQEEIDESSVCDSRTLLISEETQKVYLPYTLDEVMKKLNANPEYQKVEDVIENEYTLPLSTFKMPIISRFKEAYRFMRVKEKSSVYAALDLALELMFNSNLNPAVIRAAKDLKELNVYLDCLYENEIEKFDCFKIIYKVLPKIQ